MSSMSCSTLFLLLAAAMWMAVNPSSSRVPGFCPPCVSAQRTLSSFCSRGKAQLGSAPRDATSAHTRRASRAPGSSRRPGTAGAGRRSWWAAPSRLARARASTAARGASEVGRAPPVACRAATQAHIAAASSTPRAPTRACFSPKSSQQAAHAAAPRVASPPERAPSDAALRHGASRAARSAWRVAAWRAALGCRGADARAPCAPAGNRRRCVLKSSASARRRLRFSGGASS